MKEEETRKAKLLRFMSNKPEIIENSKEEYSSATNSHKKANKNDKNNSSGNSDNNIYKENGLFRKNIPSKIYFYCPYNRTYTKFQNYDIYYICELIKKYHLQNYYIVQIDNDNILYEEILKMQFKNESQIIHKMFDLKLDYSFSPFQDSMFFNMSILTDFFYDQIEKYLIQIFFHNHGIFIINKDACEYIHQIIMEKFIFYFVENSKFFEKSLADKNRKNKSTKILINDFNLKTIIQNFQEMELMKSQNSSNKKMNTTKKNNTNNNTFSNLNKNRAYSTRKNSSNIKENKSNRSNKSGKNYKFHGHTGYGYRKRFNSFRNKSKKMISGKENLNVKNKYNIKMGLVTNETSNNNRLDKDQNLNKNCNINNEYEGLINKENNNNAPTNIDISFLPGLRHKSFIQNSNNLVSLNNFNKIDSSDSFTNNYFNNTLNNNNDPNIPDVNISNVDNKYSKQENLVHQEEKTDCQTQNINITNNNIKNMENRSDENRDGVAYFNSNHSENFLQEAKPKIKKRKNFPNTELLQKNIEDFYYENNLSYKLNKSKDTKKSNKTLINKFFLGNSCSSSLSSNSSEVMDRGKNKFIPYNQIANYENVYKTNINNINDSSDKYNHPTLKKLNKSLESISNGSKDMDIQGRNYYKTNNAQKYICTPINSSDQNLSFERNFTFNNNNNQTNVTMLDNNFNKPIKLNGSNNQFEIFEKKSEKFDKMNKHGYFRRSYDKHTNYRKDNGRNLNNSSDFNHENINTGLLLNNVTNRSKKLVSYKNSEIGRKKLNFDLVGPDDIIRKTFTFDDNNNQNKMNFYAEDLNFLSNRALLYELSTKKDQETLEKFNIKNSKRTLLNDISLQNEENEMQNFYFDLELDNQVKTSKKLVVKDFIEQNANKGSKGYESSPTNLNDINLNFKNVENKAIDYFNMNYGKNEETGDNQNFLITAKNNDVEDFRETANYEKLIHKNDEPKIHNDPPSQLSDDVFVTPKKRKKYVHRRINFSTDELIYYLFIFSLEKLEEFTESLVKETDSLKGIYLELSEKERKDFFRRIHSMEVSMHIIFQETKIKKNFFKFAKNQFKVYNKLSNDFYFKNNFSFYLELMISKITQIELTFETLENFLKMIKENYHIIIEDKTEKENVKLNYVMKVLTILTTIYAPMNIIPGLFGMNVKVPGVSSDVDNLFPFLCICLSLVFLIGIQLLAFRKLKWF